MIEKLSTGMKNNSKSINHYLKIYSLEETIKRKPIIKVWKKILLDTHESLRKQEFSRLWFLWRVLSGESKIVLSLRKITVQADLVNVRIVNRFGLYNYWALSYRTHVCTLGTTCAGHFLALIFFFHLLYILAICCRFFLVFSSV